MVCTSDSLDGYFSNSPNEVFEDRSPVAQAVSDQAVSDQSSITQPTIPQSVVVQSSVAAPFANEDSSTSSDKVVHSEQDAFSQSSESHDSSKPFNERVYAVVKRIPRGMVATYGQVAALAGNPRNARFVGYALHANPEPGVIPCHRVVFRDGSLAPGFAFGGPDRQRMLLEKEGVTFVPPRVGVDNAGDEGWLVDLERCQWKA